MTYLGHDRLALAVFYVAERHLSPLMLIDHDLWIVDVLNLF
jgi:hypothetical protein